MAWVMAWHKGAPTREAQAILAAIQGRGLLDSWSKDTEPQRWYLVLREGKVIGWEMEFHQAQPSGAAGGEVSKQVVPSGQILLTAQWKLSNDAKQGEYRSRQVALKLPRPVVVEAGIELHEGNLRVDQNINGKRFSSSGRAPENYLPEGLMTLAIREVARRKTHARFLMVRDGYPPEQPQGGQPKLHPFSLRYLGADEQTGGARVVFSLADGQGGEQTLILNKEGKVVRREAGKRQFVATTGQEVLRLFPDAGEVVPTDDKTVQM